MTLKLTIFDDKNNKKDKGDTSEIIKNLVKFKIFKKYICLSSPVRLVFT